MKITRSDQTQSDTGIQQLSTTMEIKFSEIPDLTFEKAIAKYDEAILEIVRKQTGFALERIGADLPTSQSVDAKGRKLDAEMILQALEKIQIEFYPDGRPHELHTIGGLFSEERLKAVEQEFQNNPELPKRYDELMARKKEEWRAREASRKLVG